MARVFGAAFAMIVLGCGSGEPDPPAPEPAPPPSAPEPAEDPTPSASAEAPAATSRPPREERARVARALAQGRARAHAGEHAAALALFREGLAISPDHQPLLCEAGWAAFHARDPEAGALIRRGAEAGGEPRRRAACLYNLGRLHERLAEEGPEAERDAQLTSARRAYRDSLALRPDNRATRARLEALRDEGALETACPPEPRFDSVEALCEALLAGEHQGDASLRESCGLEPTVFRPRELSVDGEGPGQLLVVADEGSFSGNWTTWILTLRTDRGLEALAVLGHDWDRSCSSGATAIESARWWPDGERPGLEVVVHWTGSYSCGPSPWDACMERVETEGGDAQSCDDESDDNVELTDERRRLFCVEEEGRYRCSALGEPHGPLPAHAAPGPLPEGAARRAALVCPPR